MLNRVKHDEALCRTRKKSGATYLTGKRVVDVIDNKVILKDGSEITGKIIVGAGGHHDVIRRKYWDEESLNIPVKFQLIEVNSVTISNFTLVQSHQVAMRGCFQKNLEQT